MRWKRPAIWCRNCGAAYRSKSGSTPASPTIARGAGSPCQRPGQPAGSQLWARGRIGRDFRLGFRHDRGGVLAACGNHRIVALAGGRDWNCFVRRGSGLAKSGLERFAGRQIGRRSDATGPNRATNRKGSGRAGRIGQKAATRRRPVGRPTAGCREGIGSSGRVDAARCRAAVAQSIAEDRTPAAQVGEARISQGPRPLATATASGRISGRVNAARTAGRAGTHLSTRRRAAPPRRAAATACRLPRAIRDSE